MIQRIQIHNYAIIDELSIDFSARMNVITGETGAGKSILMGALSLILGDRADSSVLMQKDKKCIVEGVFSAAGEPASANASAAEPASANASAAEEEVRRFFTANDLDPDEEVVIRREIAPNGKSRAFVNDTPVNLEQLRSLSSLLVDLHRQFDTLELGEADFQREVLDALAGQGAAVEEYRSLYRSWQAAEKELAGMRARQAQSAREYDFNKFLADELSEAGFRDQELEELDQELKMLSHSEGIKAALTRAYYELKESERPVVQELRSLQQSLGAFTGFHAGLSALADRLGSVQIELQDIAGEIDHLNDSVHYDPRRIDFINDRLSTGYRLLKKHGLRTTADLIALQKRLELALQDSLQLGDAIVSAEEEAERLLKEVKTKAAVLSGGRRAQVAGLEEKVDKLLSQVGMPNARLRVSVEPGELHAFGADTVEFRFDANKSNRFEPVRKVASGGELSRLMLCIKSLVAESIDLATLIFDEIDTGISGEAARQVGNILKGLARKRQVICITHQPQIAGKADAHYFVFKELKGEGIRTRIRLLGQEERITAIAQMLGGEKPTAAALENAREMVMS
ncbi:MAG TPA: DNA repair protein RecN [Puia sp.]|nr:DNA repair protein RecN [Puia sp.]